MSDTGNDWDAFRQSSTVQHLGNSEEHQEVDHTLNAGENRYREYIEIAPNGILLIDDAGNILESNPRFKKMVGCHVAEEPTGNVMDLMNLRPPFDPMAVVRDEQSFDDELMLRRRDGSLRWTRWNIRQIGTNQNVAFVTDIHQRKQTQSALERRSEILHAVGLAAALFLKSAEWERHIYEVLALLGKASEASRVYVFENHTKADGAILTSQRHEWVDDGILSEMDNPNLQDFPYHKGGMGRWADLMAAGKIVHGLVQELPASERKILGPQGILSIIAVPIAVHDRWWGFIGFDENRRERAWPADVVDALKAAASIIGAVVERSINERTPQE